MSEEFEDKVKHYRDMGKTAFVIGYTGECGKELVKALSKNRIFNKVVLIGRRKVELNPDPGPEFKISSRDIHELHEVFLIGRRKVELNPDPGPEFEQKIVDYDKLEEYTEAFQGCEVGYCCLGTTKAKAAGREGFIKVDRDYVLKSAEISKSAGCQHFSVVTASTADKNSMFLYIKTKGEVEDALKKMSFDKLSIFKPAFLLCDRSERRLGERVTQFLMKPLICMFPTYSAVPTSYVGGAMVVDTVTPGDEKLRVHNNEQIHSLIKQDKKN